MHLGGTLEEAGVDVEDVSRVGLADRGAAEEEGHLAVSPDLPLHPIVSICPDVTLCLPPRCRDRLHRLARPHHPAQQALAEAGAADKEQFGAGILVVEGDGEE